MTKKLLVACEFSGTVREAFAKKGWDAWSCDLLPTDQPSDKHIQGDCLEAIASQKWDMIIAHPPCTFLTVSNSKNWKKLQANGKQQAAIKFVEEDANKIKINTTTVKIVLFNFPIISVGFVRTVEILMLLLLKYVSEPTIITNTKKENRIKEKAKDILPLVNSFVSFTYRE